ncbi:MAG TPA: protein kinase [Thermoanaerobaculia bacterium]|nr:protein kinase [Thermoanaerobaculia bacterium]
MSELERLRALFDRVAELPPTEREAEIVCATENNPTLEKELRALLAHADTPESMLDAPLLVTIPGYRVHRCIGRGGSATVYLADQERVEFTRTVALKVIDAVSTSLRHVREEQQILASLEHSGIARLYDSGVTALGQPYLAMEFVEGETIVEHCRKRGLPIRERIELFLSVLDAVRYAHERAIVHRDLKPANILVSARGEAKLLDFGIAQLVAPDDEDKTLTLNRAMTPAYASPEQRHGGRVTPASDIYSLGVVLYELLTDTIPFRLEDTTHEHDPQPPSAVFEGNERWRKTLRGDLDAVVLKALRYDPEDRYASAGAMADDLRRVLAGRPVAARGDDRVYRIGRFLRRHRAALAALAAAAAVALFLMPWRASRSSRASELAIFYEHGLGDGAEKLERFDGLAARDSFRRATAGPDKALAWDGVARAERMLGEVGRAADASRRAGSLLAAGLQADEAARIRAASYAANHQWSKAIAEFEDVFARQPERVDVGVALVTTLLAAGRTDAANTVFGRLRQLPAISEDPRIELLEAEVAHQLSEYQRAAAAATRAFNLAQRLGATALSLRAERIRAEAVGHLDRPEEAIRALEPLITRAAANGLARESAAARLEIGRLMTRSGGADETRKMLEQAHAGLRTAGDERGEIAARILLAIAAGRRGDVETGITAVRATVADAQRIGDRWMEANARSNLLVLLNWASEASAFKAEIAPALTALRDSGARQTLMSTVANLAIVAIEDVELDKAEAYLTEAEVLGRRVGSELARASIDRSRGYLEETRGNLDLARVYYAGALQKATTAAPSERGNYVGDLAWIEVAANRPDAAEARAKEAIEAFRAVGDLREATKTEAVLAWTDAMRGDVGSAKKRLVVLRQAADQDASTRYTSLTAEARVAAVLKDWRRAIELRRETVRMATAWNARGVRIQQQTRLAEALHGAGNRRAAEALIAEVLPEAERLGLHGLARDLRKLRAT